jgi:aminopeptidase N
MQQTARYIHHQKPLVQGKNLDSNVAYQNDIYGKGAFFMHTLRYILGDAIFFPTLKKLVTDPRYTYDKFVSSDDVEQLFSAAAGNDLKPIFDLYLRTINKLEVRIKQVSDNSYLVQLLDFDSPLPMDVQTPTGTQRMILDKKGILITSSTIPVVDPDVYYLKHVILE